MSKRLKELPLIPEMADEFLPIAERLNQWLLDSLYKPLLQSLPEGQRPSITLKNEAVDDLAAAIRSGHVVYYRGRFTGRFSAKVSRALKAIGARWRRASWYLPAADVPPAIAMAASASRARLEREVGRIDDRLRGLLAEGFDGPMVLGGVLDRTLWDAEEKVRKSTKDIVVVPHLTQEQVHKIADDYVETYTRPIKGWAQRETERLREVVKTRVLAGQRHEDLADILYRSWGMSKSHASFVARQETKLMQTTFLESRWKDAGLDKYKWHCVVGTKLHPTRPRHKELNDMSLAGKIFRLSNPPRSSEAGQPVRYNNPGRDYNCIPEGSTVSLHSPIKAFRRWYAGELTTIIADSC